MSNFSLEQKKILAEFLANIGVAWLATGLIVPIFGEMGDLSRLAITGTAGIAGMFLWISFAMVVLRRTK